MKTIIKGAVYYIMGFALFTLVGFFNARTVMIEYPDGTRRYSDLSYDEAVERIKNNEPLDFTVSESVDNLSSSRGDYSFKFSKKNYASNSATAGYTKRDVKYDQVTVVDQKYEKIATLGAKTDSFTQDEKTLKEAIKNTEALIQYEQNSGTDKHRVIQVAIGVHPTRFDELVATLKGIGSLEQFQTDVTDKTNEFRELQAQRKTLQNYRESLVELKKKSGKIEELMNLENKILEIDRQLQNLGVSLGDFDSENEFCTVKFTLREEVKEKPEVILIEVMKRLQKGIAWAVQYYFYFTLVMALFSGVFWVFARSLSIFKAEKQKDS